jgi:hypothetical protein
VGPATNDRTLPGSFFARGMAHGNDSYTFARVVVVGLYSRRLPVFLQVKPFSGGARARNVAGAYCL